MRYGFPALDDFMMNDGQFFFRQMTQLYKGTSSFSVTTKMELHEYTKTKSRLVPLDQHQIEYFVETIIDNG